MKKGIALLLSLLMLVLIPACSPQNSPTAEPKEDPLVPEVVVVGKSNAGERIEVNQGQQIRIQLEAVPGTGFRWDIDQMDESIVKTVGESEFYQDTEGILTGGAEWQLTHLESVAPGETTLEMVYHQAWDKETPPAETFKVTLVVLKK